MTVRFLLKQNESLKEIMRIVLNKNGWLLENQSLVSFEYLLLLEDLDMKLPKPAETIILRNETEPGYYIFVSKLISFIDSEELIEKMLGLEQSEEIQISCFDRIQKDFLQAKWLNDKISEFLNFCINGPIKPLLYKSILQVISQKTDNKKEWFSIISHTALLSKSLTVKESSIRCLSKLSNSKEEFEQFLVLCDLFSEPESCTTTRLETAYAVLESNIKEFNNVLFMIIFKLVNDDDSDVRLIGCKCAKVFRHENTEFQPEYSTVKLLEFAKEMKRLEVIEKIERMESETDTKESLFAKEKSNLYRDYESHRRIAKFLLTHENKE